jgi:Mce-associated membrane protein
MKAEVVAEDADSQASIETIEAADGKDTGGGEQREPTPATVDDIDDGESSEAQPKPNHRPAWTRVAAYGVLPGVALLLALGAGYLKWQDSSVRDSNLARIGSVQTAKDSTVALLSYRPDSVDKDLGAARDRLTGNFRDSYTSLTNDVVIPGAKQKHISAVAAVRAAASVSANENRAVILVFVNQTVTVGNDPPTDTASAVKVTLNRADGRWLISEFEPV